MPPDSVSRLQSRGVLRWSTSLILASGITGLTSCERKVVATAEDARIAKMEAEVERLDSQRAQLLKGELANNFELPGLGFYHAAVNDFYPVSYNTQENGRWFVNGEWKEAAGQLDVPPSRPSTAALQRVEQQLTKERETWEKESAAPATASSGSTAHHYHGAGFGQGLMLYWLLSGNRGHYNPGPGFQQTAPMAGRWEQNVEQNRNAVRSYSQTHPSYSNFVARSKATGSPVREGMSVRGGFGSGSRSSSGFNSSSSSRSGSSS